MALVPVVNAGGGSVPAAEVHPPLEGGHIVGHGGVALRLFVALTGGQSTRLDNMGQVEAPLGRRGRHDYYWPLKTDPEMAVRSAADAFVPALDPRALVLRPVSVTYVGLREMTVNGALYSVDAEQLRLYAPLRMPAPRDDDGNVFYEVHGAYTVA
jgi:hypothetical protein